MQTSGRRLFLLFLLLFAGVSGSPAFGQCITPDVNADRAVNASDALILYYSYSLRSELGSGRGGAGAGTAAGGPVVSIAAQAPSVVEGAPAVFVLTVSPAAPTMFTVRVTVSVTGDFGVATGTRPVVFEVCDTTATLSINTKGDAVAELAGTVTAAVEAGAGYAIRAPATASVTIADDDEVGVATSTPLTPGGLFRDCAACPEMVVVPGGAFTMGGPDGETGSFGDERPQREVTIARFAVGRHEVTFAEWDACRAAGGCARNPEDESWGRGTRPVIHVNWDEAKQYAAWLTRETGASYRLLSEAEWEYAARAGEATAYHWGNDVGSGNANCDGCGSSRDDVETAPVGSFAANAFGLHDLSGNVLEWTEDCWHSDYTNAPEDGRAWGEENQGDCNTRMLRGGSWDNPPVVARSAARYSVGYRHRGADIGFRVARTLAERGDAEDAVEISIAASSSSVVEGAPALFVLSADEAPLTALTVQVVVSVTGDFGVTAGVRPVAFGAGERTATLRVDSEDDEVDEANGRVTATMLSGVGYVAGDPSTASVEIADNDEVGIATSTPLMAGARFRDCAACPEMVVVPGGTFMMGSPDFTGGADEEPQHEVTIARFAVGRFEVRFDEWDACVRAGGCTRNPDDESWGRGTRPVIDVNRDEAQQYAAWLTRETGETYRLLTESEWEYAARAGAETAYFWGNAMRIAHANCDGCSSPPWEGRQTAPVGSFVANAFGLYDVSGNVNEWVEDCWHDSYADLDGNVTAPTDGRAWGSENDGDCGTGVLRGGSWDDSAQFVRSATRHVSFSFRHRGAGFGFRVARTLVEGEADDDVEISIAAESPSVVEGAPAQFVLSASEAPQTALTINIAVSAMGDFGVTTGLRTVAFGAGASAVTLSIDSDGDEVNEADGAVTATMVNGAGYAVGSPSTASVAVADDDEVAMVAPTPSTAAGTTFRDCADCPEMVVVPGGTFTMGSPTSDFDHDPNERPQHEVTIARFAVGRFEVRFDEWDACVSAGQCTRNPDDESWGRDTRPVIDINWNEAKQYVAWLSRETGETYRLLTESEWEYVARAGTTTVYLLGDTVGSGHANCDGCGGDWEDRNQTAPVGGYAANAFGLHDTLGNAREWVEDCWHDRYGDLTSEQANAPTDGSAWGSEDGGDCGSRVSRGGSWSDPPENTRFAARHVLRSRHRGADVGFRVARVLDWSPLSALAAGAGFRECADCPEMVVVPSGTFTMGESATVYGSDANERPRHEVTIDYRFAAGRYEVTLDEWDACVRAGGCVHNPEEVEWGRGDRPVISVSWIGAKEYVAWLSRKTGGTYRLLTESEWEYAARAATTTIYYWGDEVGVGHASCWGCRGEWDGSTVGGPAPVGSFAANAFGLHDLLGNVWEWVEDCWHDDYTGAPDDGRAWEDEDGEDCDRVLRGGAWNNRPGNIRSANRRPYYPGDQIIIFGFRVARTLD